ncbi:MAG: aspartate--tRNA(Asn) ligase [Clostridia bacterium]|nr:aspartate--tRNA(Asn) ligase [Clostridia bacterium]
MKRTLIEAIGKNHEETIKLSGWIHKIKKLKSVVFVILRDRSGLIQLAMEPTSFPNLRLESVIEVKGKVMENPNKYGVYEIQVTYLRVLSEVKEELPVTIHHENLNQNIDVLLNHRVLSLRHHTYQKMIQVQNSLVEGFRGFLSENGFTEIRTPKLVKEGAEGGSNVFKLDYFGETAYLAQSPQFYKQMMVMAGLERVFEIGPVFRAEAHSTSRHLNEYTSMDLEMGFVEDEHELMRLETELLRKMFEKVMAIGVEVPEIPEVIPTLKLSEAITIIKNVYHHEVEGDLDPKGEKLIAQYIFQKTGSEFVFLTHYPKYKRPMYTMPAEKEETRSFDLLFRGLEITTGGLRINGLEALIASMKEKGLNPENYSSYLEAFKYGAPPHGGLAIGLERLTSMILGYENIRHSTLFPRDINRLLP